MSDLDPLRLGPDSPRWPSNDTGEDKLLSALVMYSVALWQAGKSKQLPWFKQVSARLLSMLQSSPSRGCVQNIAMWITSSPFNSREEVTPFHAPLMRVLLAHWKDAEWRDCCKEIIKSLWKGPYGDQERQGGELEVCKEALQLYPQDSSVVAGALEVLLTLVR